MSKTSTIPNFNKVMKMERTEALGLLASLRLAIDQIYNKNASTLRFEELYRCAYNLVLYKHGELLYEGVTEIILGHLKKSVSSIDAHKNDELIKCIVGMWSEHTVAFKMISDILMYMDTTYVEKQAKNKAKVYVLALRLFKENVVFHPDIRERLRLALLSEIESERRGCIVDRNLLKTALVMYVDLSIYEEEFEVYFLTETKTFYAVESLSYLTTNTCPDYLSKVECRLNEESARVVNYLDRSSEKKLFAVVERELIAAHAAAVIEMESSGLLVMLRDDKLLDLRRLYNLFSRVPDSLDLLRDGLAKYLTERGEEVLNSEDSQRDPVSFVRQILLLKDKFDTVLRESFKSEKKCQKRLKEAFEDFVNKDARCASYLAGYVDELLKSGGTAASITASSNASATTSAGVSEDLLDAQLEKVIVIFKYIRDKDIFESYYRTLLSKRLLAGKSGSEEVEKLMIGKLKAECGYQFTNKLEGMFVDISNSRGVMESYRRTQLFSTAPIELDIHILTTGYWPMSPQAPCVLPPVVAQCCDIFTAFYLDKHSGRKLNWIMQAGSADIKAAFPGGRKELNVSNYQMCVLMLFNHQDTLSLSSIRSATNIPDLELRRHLLSLCTPKLRILKKASKGKGIEDDDQFSFNDEFTSKFKRIKVPLISLKEVLPSAASGASAANGSSSSGAMVGEGGGALGDLPSSVEEERRHLVEAAVVRTMKTRKSMNHNDLIAEVVRQLSVRFTPSPPFIKKRIESLIEREFLQRNKDDARMYDYLA